MHRKENKRKIAVIVNPIGGRKQGRKIFETYLGPALDLAMIDFEKFETQSATWVDEWVK
jgi:hypothetical protein